MASHCRFTVQTVSDPQALLRVLGLFSQRDFVPQALTARQTDDGLELCIEQQGMEPAMAALVLNKIRSVVLVHSADLTIS